MAGSDEGTLCCCGVGYVKLARLVLQVWLGVGRFGCLDGVTGQARTHGSTRPSRMLYLSDMVCMHWSSPIVLTCW